MYYFSQWFSRLEIMAYYTKKKIEKTAQEEIIVSKQTEKFIATDGSIHSQASLALSTTEVAILPYF